MSAHDEGFTLVEVLVSILIFSLISLGALLALSTTLNAREAAQDRINRIDALAAARHIMAEDFATLVRRQNRDGLGGFIDPSRALNRSDQISLTRRARANPDGVFARGDLLRISWRVEEGRLIRSFLPHENPARVEPAIDRIVLQGVRSMQIDPLFESGRVPLRAGPQDLTLADALSITLTHDDGATTRHVFALPDV